MFGAFDKYTVWLNYPNSKPLISISKLLNNVYNITEGKNCREQVGEFNMNTQLPSYSGHTAPLDNFLLIGGERKQPMG